MSVEHPRRSPTPESWRLFGLLLLIFAVRLFSHINDFQVPESDFFDYREKAISIRQLNWPSEFKRPPLYAAAIALLSAPISGHHRELYAAEALTALAAVAALYFFFRLTDRVYARMGVLALWWWCLHPSTLVMALKPRAEMVALLFIVWAFYLYASNRRAAYGLAAVASLLRYEGAVAIAAFMLADFIFTREKWKSLAFGCIGVLPIVLWTLFNSNSDSSGSFFSYFSGLHLNWAFLPMMAQAWGGFFPGHGYQAFMIFTFVMAPAGLCVLYRYNRSLMVSLTAYMAGFFLMEMIWPFADPGYATLIVWALILPMVLGTMAVFNFLLKRWSRLQPDPAAHLKKAWPVKSALLLTGLFTWFCFSQKSVPGLTGISSIYLGLYLIPVIYFFASRWWRTRGAVGMVLVGLCLALAFFMNRQLENDLYFFKYSKAEFRLVAEWFSSHFQPGDRLLVSQPPIVAYLARMDVEPNFVNLADVPAEAAADLPGWLRGHKLTYVAFLKYNERSATGGAWSDWVFEHRGMAALNPLASGAIPGLKMVETLTTGPRWAKIYKVQ